MKCKKMYLQLNQECTGYWFMHNARTKNIELEYVALSFSEKSHDFGIMTHEFLESNEIVICSTDSPKKKSKVNLSTRGEELLFEQEYDKYYDKRWKEMPLIEMTISDYEHLKQKWEKLSQEKPLYTVFSLDDSQHLDKVDVIGKNELSDQDLQEMQRDNEECLRWQKAVRLYNFDHEIVDDLWRSSKDSVYDVDIEKYLDRTEGFVKHKVYTKADVIAQLQEKLKKSDPIYLIVHWLRIRMIYSIAQSDHAFDDLLRYFANMDNGYPDMISREKLQEIADRLSLGQDVILD